MGLVINFFILMIYNKIVIKIQGNFIDREKNS